MRILFLMCLLILTSCATQKVTSLQPFVETSQKYLDGSDLLLQQAKNSAFASSDATVSLKRHRLDDSAANHLIRSENNEMSSYFELVRQLRRQRSLLYSYFSTLSALPETKIAGEKKGRFNFIGDKLSWLWPKGEDKSSEMMARKPANLSQEIANNLILVNRQIETLEVNGQRIESLMEHSPAILVTRLGSPALEEELRQRETLIRYSLSLHRAALQAISMKMDHDLDTLKNQKEALRQKIEKQVESPYKNTAQNLNYCWAANRQLLLEEFANLEADRRDVAKAASLAEEGANYMQRAFYAFLEGEENIYELPMLDLKTQELKSLLESAHQPMLRALPEGCQNNLSSMAQVQPVAVAVPVMPVVEEKLFMAEKASNKAVAEKLQSTMQKEYTNEGMRNWANMDQYGPIEKGDTMFSIAKNMRVDGRYSVAQVMAALFKLNPKAFNLKKVNLLKLGATLFVPTAAKVEALTSKQARAFVAKHQ